MLPALACSAGGETVLNGMRVCASHLMSDGAHSQGCTSPQMRAQPRTPVLQGFVMPTKQLIIARFRHFHVLADDPAAVRVSDRSSKALARFETDAWARAACAAAEGKAHLWFHTEPVRPGLAVQAAALLSVFSRWLRARAATPARP